MFLLFFIEHVQRLSYKHPSANSMYHPCLTSDNAVTSAVKADTCNLRDDNQLVRTHSQALGTCRQLY